MDGPRKQAKPASAQPPADRLEKAEFVDSAWERVLDCGAPGPGREPARLFYQEPASNQGAPAARNRGDD